MTTTSMNSVSNAGLDFYQMAQSMQLKADEKSTAQELKAEERQTENISTPEISMGKYSETRMFHIRQAAEVGILRPIWLEAVEILNMNPDMPRMSDIIHRVAEKKDVKSEHNSDAAKNADSSERAADGSESTDKSERAADGFGSTDKSERVAVGFGSADVSGITVDLFE